MSTTATAKKTPSDSTKNKAQNIESIYPLSPMQAGLLFHTLMNPGTGVYLLQYRHIMTMTQLDIAAFKQAWQQVVARHEVLRTSFVWKKQKRPLQVVHRQVELPVEILDWRHCDAAMQAQQLDDLLAQERARGFDFTKAPLMSVRLIRLDDTRYQFVRSYHHILMDAWCFSLIMMDFLNFYRAITAGETLSLPKPAPYKQFIHWLQNQNQAAALNFWRNKLAGFDTPTQIVPASGQPAVASAETEVADCITLLSREDTQRAQEAARQNSITLNTLVQAAWSILLSRYVNEEEILFGVTVAGRPISMPEMGTVVGLFINSIPLRWHVPARGRLKEWLQALFAENLSLREYEYASLPDIQRCAEVESEQSLFQSLFVFENAPFDAGLKQENLEFLVSDATNRTHTNYPLTIVVIPGEQLHLQITWHCTHFQKAYVERMLQHFENILINMLNALQSREDRAIDSIEMLSKKEQYFLFHEQNPPYRRDQRDDCISRFEGEVTRQPEKIAAVELTDPSTTARSLNYEQLNRQVNRLAHALLAKGVRPDQRVALMAQRNTDLLTMILAVLKCGAAYLPLDPKHPPQRLAEILQLSACAQILSQKALVTQIEEAQSTSIHGQNLWVYESLLENSDNTRNPGIPCHPCQLAYLIFTSGSTGKPKGVMVERAGMLNNILGKIPSLGLGQEDVIAQTASQCFDISVWQFLAGVMVGGTVVILPDCIAHDPKALTAALEAQGVTLAEVVPSLIRDMLDNPTPLSCLRWMLPTGEALPPELARQWIQRYPDIPLMNAYGPAECSDDVAFYAIHRPLKPDVVHTPIGSPTLNLQLYVLDRNLRPMPRSAIGELYVAGVGVGRGYVNRPGLTAETFLPNPFGQEAGERMYKTGDLARINDAGELEYVGRLDGQVKLRGFRIELGEIEARLNEHPALHKSVVIVREDNPGDQRLVAYCEPAPGSATPTAADSMLLPDFLAAKLPSYMVPAAFVCLDKLPLSANGKINRHALPTPDYGNVAEAEFVAPRNETEREVAGIWQTVLKLDTLSIEDNFFRSGGHSLLATQAVARMSATFDLDLSLRSLFDYPTIEMMARHIESLRSQGGATAAQTIPRLSERENLPLSYAQQRLWFLYRLEGPGAAYNMPVAIRLRGQLDKQALSRAVQFIVDRHEALRTCFKEVNGEAQQVILPSVSVDVEEIALDSLDDELAVLKKHSMHCFELENAPLLSARLIRLSEDEHMLSVVLHHIVADGWSVRVLVDEFTHAYAAYANNHIPQPKALPIQYADYAHWQRQYLRGEVLQKQLDYWREKLGEGHGVLSLPSDRPRPARQSYRGARLDFYLDETLARQVRAAAQRQGTTGFVILLAAYQALLARYSGQDDIRVGVPIANRQRLETEGLIGFFVNTQVLRAKIPETVTAAELFDQVRHSTVEAQDAQDLPFEYLVNELKPERDLSHSPLFQAMFNLLQGKPTDALALPGLAVEAVPVLPDTAMFDLNLDLHDEGHVYRGSLEYSTDLFNRGTAQRLMDSYRVLLSAMLAEPAQPIARLPLLPEVERRRIVHDWNRHRSDDNFAYPWLRRFEDRVAQHGGGIAAVCGDESLTLAELNRRANALAWQLLEYHQRAELSDQVVAVLGERKLNLLVQIIAVFKTGAAYLPLDPGQPAERHHNILSTAQAALVLCQSADQAEALAEQGDYPVFCQQRGGTGERGENPGIYPRPDQLAYVIFTSGSTGKPKGAMVTQRGMLNNMLSKVPLMQLGAKDRIAQTASQCFDISVWQLLTGLISGAQVHVIPEEVSRNAEALSRAVAHQRITVLEIVPSLLKVMLAMDEHDNPLDSLRYMMPTGEALDSALARQWFARYPEIPLINAYGPAECADDVSMHVLTGTETLNSAYVPIGRPTANNALYVLDAHLQPAPVGVTGEIYVAGIGVGRGYLNAPALTAQRFIPSPFVHSGGAPERLYRTGDLARYNEVGVLEFLGRADFQVKLRGYRIELGEIENSLVAIDGVGDAVVAVQEQQGRRQLAAYWVASERGGLSDRDLKRLLGQRLPDYMIPGLWMQLPRLPLNANGKVDRLALPKVAVDSQRPMEVPGNPIEEKLAVIWCRLLQQEQISIHDNFFELGGDSILSLQIVAQAKAEGIELSPAQLFEYQSVYELARVCRVSDGLDDQPRRRAVAEEKAETGPVALSPVQRDFFAQNLAQPDHWNMALVFDVTRPLNPGSLEKSVEALVRHHDILRARYKIGEEGPEQTIDGTNSQTVCERHQPGSATADAGEIAAAMHASLDLAAGPIFRVAYLSQGDSPPGQLIFVAHHLVVDGVSWRILLEDLQDLYQQIESGEPSPHLPAKTSSYAAWTEHLLTLPVDEQPLAGYAYVGADTVAASASVGDYWRQLEQALGAERIHACNRLPVAPDFEPEQNTFGNQRQYESTVDTATTETLLKDAGRAYNSTIQDTLLAALTLTMSRWHGQESVWIELESHGREDIGAGLDLSRTVGWFTSLYPICLRADNNDLGATLRGVKESLRAVPQKGLTFGLLKYRDGQLQSLPRPNITFNYFGQYDQAVQALDFLRPSEAPHGPLFHPHNRATALLEINANVLAGQLRLRWSYAGKAFSQGQIAALADEYGRQLENLVAHCLDAGKRGTPSDFPLVPSRQSQLDALFQNYAEEEIEDVYPLSPVQSGMLFHSLYDNSHDSGVYFDQMTAELDGDLDRHAFTQAWEVVTARHAILRSAFLADAFDEPVQVVFKQVGAAVDYHNWQDLKPDAQDEELGYFLCRDVARGFDLRRAPVMRINLIQRQPSSYLLVWSHHHIALDGWCAILLVEEVLATYKALTEGGNAVQVAQARAPSFKGYIAWLRERALGEGKRAERVFWQDYLAGFHQASSLPLQGNGEAHSTEGYGEVALQLDEQQSQVLADFARQQRVTLSSVMQLAWGMLLNAYSGEEDIIFGVTTAGRPTDLPGVDQMLGMFINTLPLRMSLPADREMSELIREVQNRSTRIRDFEHTPLVEIQDASPVTAGEALFNSIFVFENLPKRESADTAAWPVQLKIRESREQTHYPLTLTIVPGDSIQLQLLYKQSDYCAVHVETIARHYRQILEFLSSPDARVVGDLSLLSEQERRQQLVEWNATRAPYPSGLCIHQQFEAQVARTPDATAVVFEGQSLSYAELNQRANQLAQYLLETRRVRPDDRVGIYLERSLEMVIGIWAVLKAGAAYVPLDPSYPESRLRDMCTDAEVRCVLSAQSLRDSIPTAADKAICLDDDAVQTALAVYSRDNIDPVLLGLTSRHLAYVIYTSGSTGRPKGVMVEHEALVNRIDWMHKEYGAGPDDSFIQKTPFSFDVSVWEFVWPMICGARLVVARPEGHKDPHYLCELIRAQQVSRMHFVPSMLANMLTFGDLGQCPSLQQVYCSGEALQPHHVEGLRKACPWLALHNLYGPTEAAIDVSYWPCFEAGDNRLPTLSRVPIGKPIQNIQLYVLDSRLNPVLPGVVGELHIGGVGLARGYLNRDDLTREKFIANPFHQEGAGSSNRLYKTGDLVRWLPDGNLEYLGRADFQIKLRGLRIELGEIEHALNRQAVVRESTVLVKTTPEGEQRLVAYIVPQHPQPFTDDAHRSALVESLRQALGDLLPDYMVPGAFVLLDALPLSLNGKVDRKALPEPDMASAQHQYVAPETPLESELCALWREILGLEQVGVMDNFFHLGGHSLLAMKLKSRVQTDYQVQLDITALFERPTVGALAEQIQTAQSATQDDIHEMDALLAEFE